MFRIDDENKIISSQECRAAIVGIQKNRDISYSMEELAGLAEAAGAHVAGQMIQKTEKMNPATLIGAGKVLELAEICESMELDTVIFNEELNGAQIRNLENALDRRVIDRTILILDIFAMRALSKEGRLQVELAQLKYRLPRLTGFGKSLSRLGGGIGTRGPGEKKLETDRRHINKRINDIKKELIHIKTSREAQNSKRKRSRIPVVALVGYTNSGKSALMNRMLEMTEKEEKSVASEDMLFASLDTQHRSIKLKDGKTFILVDTVGFVSELPHMFLDAFKATLEEAVHADLLLQVADLTCQDQDFHNEVTKKVLEEIGAGHKEKITVYTKADMVPENEIPVYGSCSVAVSAETGDNMETLMKMIQSRIFADRIDVSLLIPYSNGELFSYICERGTVKTKEYMDEGIRVKAQIPQKDYHRVKAYEII